MSDVTLLHGDCLELMPTLPANSVQMVFADPPYATIRRRVTDNAWDVPFDVPLMWQHVLRIKAKNAVSVFTCQRELSALLLTANPKMYRYDLVWDKVRASRHLHAKRMPMLQHESLMVFYTPPCTYNPQMTLREKPIKMGGIKVLSKNYSQPNKHLLDPETVYTHRHPTTLLRFSRENYTVHPTQKPVALLEWLITTYTKSGDLVLDPFAGSGTTALAAMRTGRKVICIEKDATYFEVMKKRVADEQAKAGAA